jgi:aldehyde dehydrogenase (NAD+)
MATTEISAGTDHGAGTPPAPTGVVDAVTTARAAFDRGVTRPIAGRERRLEALVQLLDEGEGRLLDALATDVGKPRMEAWATDLGVTASEIKLLGKHVAKWAKPRRASLPLTAMPGRGRIQPEPLGTVLIIAPWNYPVQLLLEPLAAALAAGNAAVVKPSELAPATSAVLTDLLNHHLDDDAVQVIEGGPEVATELLEQRWDHIFFTGSTKVGRVVAEAAAKHLTPVTLELGGKSPAIVHQSANLEVAGRRIAWGKFLNAGQTCIAPDYVLVDEAVQDELIEHIRTAVKDFYGEDPKASADYARIVNGRHFDRLSGLLEGGGRAVLGGTTDADDRYIAPTVLVDTPPAAAIMQEEIFGPLLPVLPVASVAEAIDRVNSRPKPLALYVFAGDDDVVDAVLDRTSSGGVCVNHTILHITPPELPFGGVGESGIGRYHGRSGFDTFSNLKSVLRKPTFPDPALLYPPYTSGKERIVRKAL